MLQPAAPPWAAATAAAGSLHVADKVKNPSLEVGSLITSDIIQQTERKAEHGPDPALLWRNQSSICCGSYLLHVLYIHSALKPSGAQRSMRGNYVTIKSSDKRRNQTKTVHCVENKQKITV